MTEFNENLIKFGWLTKDEMLLAIEDGNLDAYDICFCKDTNEQYLIDSDLNPISIKSRVRIYHTVEAAMEDINKGDSPSYAGEIISVRDGEKFIAYIVNKFEDGKFYISPVFSENQIDYNLIQNVPITNLNGSVTDPIVLKDLESGYYKITGHFIEPKDNREITSIVGNFVFIEKEINTTTIKRISSTSIIDYTINEVGGVVSKTYATEEYIEQKGFTTKDYVDSQLAALDIVTREQLEIYVSQTCAALIRTLINEELNVRYSTDSDIKNLFS